MLIKASVILSVISVLSHWLAGLLRMLDKNSSISLKPICFRQTNYTIINNVNSTNLFKLKVSKLLNSL